jgi:hypothetical protein
MADISPFAKARLENIQREVGHHLGAISKVLPPGYKITFIARNVDIPNGQVVMTEDDNLELVAQELLSAGDLK